MWVCISTCADVYMHVKIYRDSSFMKKIPSDSYTKTQTQIQITSPTVRF